MKSRFVYIVLSTLLFIILFPILVLHRKTRDGFWERFGFYRPGTLPTGEGPRLWLHGASAGDLLALSPMLEQLRARIPNAQIILSTTTNTGRLMATQRLKDRIDAVVYAPWDLFGATRRAVRSLRPSLLVLEYTEIWPNLIRAASNAGARIALTNGRFSPANIGRYRWLFRFAGNPLERIDLLLMREQEEADRALRLGAVPSHVHVTGNTKFDALTADSVEQEDVALRDGLGLGKLVLICGSTHEGEEELLLQVYGHLRGKFPELQLVIAPRYIDRAPRVAAMARSLGVGVALRSAGNRQRAPIVVLDTIGELGRVYRLGTVVFVGGSFMSRGGQNILEPAAQGRPVLFGPNMSNFHDSVQVLVGRGGIQVNDPDHLERVLADLLARPEQLHALGELARTTVRQISGASVRNVELLARLLPA